MNKFLTLTTAILLALVLNANAQFLNTPDELIYYTSEWTGERFEDGRPKVADEILERMKKVSIEEAWGVLRSKGYHTQFDGNWVMIHDDQPVVGHIVPPIDTAGAGSDFQVVPVDGDHVVGGSEAGQGPVTVVPQVGRAHADPPV